MTEEHRRREAARNLNTPWRRSGPFLSERQWGTVREDYGLDGNAWDYFSHDQVDSPVRPVGRERLARERNRVRGQAGEALPGEHARGACSKVTD